MFAIFACGHEFLVLWTLASTRVLTENVKMTNVIKINKVAAVLYIEYLVGGGNELFDVKFIDECV